MILLCIGFYCFNDNKEFSCKRQATGGGSLVPIPGIDLHLQKIVWIHRLIVIGRRKGTYFIHRFENGMMYDVGSMFWVAAPIAYKVL